VQTQTLPAQTTAPHLVHQLAVPRTPSHASAAAGPHGGTERSGSQASLLRDPRPRLRDPLAVDVGRTRHLLRAARDLGDSTSTTHSQRKVTALLPPLTHAKGASVLPAFVPMGLNLHLHDDQEGASAGERRVALASPGDHTGTSSSPERPLNGLLKAAALLGAVRGLFTRCGGSWAQVCRGTRNGTSHGFCLQRCSAGFAEYG